MSKNGSSEMTRDRSLTILLTLKGRPHFTLRWMSYANEIRFPFKVLVADGGEDRIVSETLSNNTAFPEVDYEYVQYPFDLTLTHYYEKVSDALSRIESPFVAIADNDDFYVVEGYRRAVGFLQNHPEYSSCRGEVGWFWIWPSVVDNQDGADNLYGEIIRIREPYLHESTIAESASERVRNLCSHYSPTIYDVHRTDQFRELWQTVRDQNLQDVYLLDWLISFLNTVRGNVRREPGLYMLQQLNAPNRAVGEHATRQGDQIDRILSDWWPKDFTKLVNSIAQAIAMHDKSSFEDAQLIVRREFRNFLIPHISKCLVKEEFKLSDAALQMAQKIVRRLEYDSSIRANARKLYSLFSIARRYGPLTVPSMISKHLRRRRGNALAKSFGHYEEIKPILDFLAEGDLNAQISS